MKMKKILGAVLTLAVTASLMSITAAADPVVYDDFSKVGISKTLNVADSVDISNVKDFTFKFTAEKGEGTSIEDAEKVFTNNGLSDEITITVGDQSNGSAVGYKTFADIFGPATNFSHAGEYIYTVEETTQPFDDNPATPNIVEKLTVDKTKYKVRIHVVNDGDSLGYKQITVTNPDDEKVDPTINPDDGSGDPNKKVGVSGANFTNTYKVGFDTTDGSRVLKVVKSITGDYGDKTKEFPVTVKFVIPQTATQDDVKVAAGSVTWSDSNDFEGSCTRTLKDGDTIEFTKLPVGTIFYVSENQDRAYRSKITGFVATEDTDYVSGSRTDIPGKAAITTNNNVVYIENNRNGIIPTGLVVNSLPYAGLVVLAAAGLTFFAIKKRAAQ